MALSSCWFGVSIPSTTSIRNVCVGSVDWGGSCARNCRAIRWSCIYTGEEGARRAGKGAWRRRQWEKLPSCLRTANRPRRWSEEGVRSQRRGRKEAALQCHVGEGRKHRQQWGAQPQRCSRGTFFPFFFFLFGLHPFRATCFNFREWNFIYSRRVVLVVMNTSFLKCIVYHFIDFKVSCLQVRLTEGLNSSVLMFLQTSMYWTWCPEMHHASSYRFWSVIYARYVLRSTPGQTPNTPMEHE